MGHEVNLLDIKSAHKTAKVSTQQEELKRIIEALLFAAKEPLSLDKMRTIISTVYPITKQKLTALLEQLQKEYQIQKRAFKIDEIAGGYVLRTVEEMAPYLELLYPDRRSDKLSEAAIEVLAIVAYKGPITRPEIEQLRGVDSSATLASLQERGLVEAIGRKNMPGRPMQYATTEVFLRYFGLKNAQELKLL